MSNHYINHKTKTPEPNSTGKQTFLTIKHPNNSHIRWKYKRSPILRATNRNNRKKTRKDIKFERKSSGNNQRYPLFVVKHEVVRNILPCPRYPHLLCTKASLHIQETWWRFVCVFVFVFCDASFSAFFASFSLPQGKWRSFVLEFACFIWRPWSQENSKYNVNTLMHIAHVCTCVSVISFNTLTSHDSYYSLYTLSFYLHLIGII